MCVMNGPSDIAVPPAPLADRLRPQSLAEVAGQEHLTGPAGALTRLLEIAVARLDDLLGSAGHRQDDGRAADRPAGGRRVRAGLGDPFRRRRAEEDFRRGARAPRGTGAATLLFVDEIHRFNRAQQDSFLPVMEDGSITLIGATTENPSFELNAALLSRARVLVFRPLDEAAIEKLIARAESARGAGRFRSTRTRARRWCAWPTATAARR